MQVFSPLCVNNVKLDQKAESKSKIETSNASFVKCQNWHSLFKMDERIVKQIWKRKKAGFAVLRPFKVKPL
jgi:hypothetical protein